MSNKAEHHVVNFVYPIVLIAYGIIGIIYMNDTKAKIANIKQQDYSNIIINMEQPEFLFKGPQEGLMEALEYYQVPHADIVYAQAVLETGNFQSNPCKKHNNLFGLFDSSRNRYMHFNHWSNSVECYKTLISSRYNGKEDYYHFLKRIKYAKDPKYVSKVEDIRRKLSTQQLK